MPIHQLNIRRIGAKIAKKYIHFKRDIQILINNMYVLLVKFEID